MEETKEISKKAAEKAKKKAEKAAKKAEYALRPKEPKPEKPKAAPKVEDEGPVQSIFDYGWLKKVYEEKPCANVRTRFPPEPNGLWTNVWHVWRR
jgi:glutaminyl-tRNA synthetase